MDTIRLEDEFGGLRRRLHQMEYLCEIVNGYGVPRDPEDKLRFLAFTELLADLINTAVEDAIKFENTLHSLIYDSVPGSSLTSAAPITSTAPSMPSASICSRSSSADSSTATTGSM